MGIIFDLCGSGMKWVVGTDDGLLKEIKSQLRDGC